MLKTVALCLKPFHGNLFPLRRLTINNIFLSQKRYKFHEGSVPPFLCASVIIKICCACKYFSIEGSVLAAEIGTNTIQSLEFREVISSVTTAVLFSPSYAVTDVEFMV